MAESGELLPAPHVSEYDGTPPSGRIAFSVGQSGCWDLFVINADGTGLTQLTDEDGVDWSPS